MLSWVISTVLAIGLNKFFPRFITEVFTNRILMSAYLPLGALSALILSSLAQIGLPRVKLGLKLNSKRIYIDIHDKKILIYFLMILAAFLFLSYVYSIEFLYQGESSLLISKEERSLYEYLASLSPEKRYLTYSYPVYLRVSSLTAHKTYGYYQYGNFVSWPVEILFTTSSPEVAHYFLYKLGVTHVILTKQDLTLLSKMTDSALASMLNFLPLDFNNSFALVYSVPNYVNNEFSNYVLVKPTTYYSPDMFNKFVCAFRLYNAGYNALTAAQIPFTIIDDYKINKIIQGYVYIIPSSLPSRTSAKVFVDQIAAGSYAVVLYDSAISDENMNELLNFLGVKPEGLSLTDGIKMNNEYFNFSIKLYTTNLTINSSYDCRGIYYYKTPENKTIPFMIFFKIKNGSIVFINMPRAFNLNRVTASIVVYAVREATAFLPKPIASKNPQVIFYPSGLFELGNPKLINIYNSKNLNNYIYTFSNITLKGNISIVSNYIILSIEDTPIKKLVLQNMTHQETLENISLKKIEIYDFYNLTLLTNDAVIYNSGSELPNIKVTLYKLKIYIGDRPINFTVKQNNKERRLLIAKSYIEFEFPKNFVINLRLQKPLITLDNGSLNMSWKGVFWYGGKIFTTVAKAEYWPISGKLSLEIVDSDKIILIKLLNIDSINVTVSVPNG